MILNRKYYSRPSFIKNLWNNFQMRKLTGQKIFRSFRLHQTIFPDRIYFYSPRLKGKPRFSGNVTLLKSWPEARFCEGLCPTNAIKVTENDFIIDPAGCIACGLCVEAAPEGLLVVTSELSLTSR
jgi:formate hydrogenlyase subunit 6/NADH:ubiquinone oxidoreductase subunit I